MSTVVVNYNVSTVEEYVEKHGHELSQPKIFLKSDYPLPIGTRLRFQLQLKDGRTVITVESRVVSIRKPDALHPDQVSGFEIEFTKFSPESLPVLERIRAKVPKP